MLNGRVNEKTHLYQSIIVVDLIGTSAAFPCVVIVDILFLLIGPAGVLRSLQLDLQSFHSDLEAVHCLNGRLSTGWIVERNEACTQIICIYFKLKIQCLKHLKKYENVKQVLGMYLLLRSLN